ncbi:hypothetical protein Tco_0992291 [Tanacetum coccineum]|uniref:Uncharacterized protein n=1 Tax=Tanacetum coccineum TaxID=301880 RepID=A0ABQ5F3C4_9ASTR
MYCVTLAGEGRGAVVVIESLLLSMRRAWARKRNRDFVLEMWGAGSLEDIRKKKEIEPDEEPPRGTLWLKGRVNKDEEYPDDEIRSVGDKLISKEKGGYARGVGSGVTYKRYFDLPRSKQSSDERILLLQSQLDNERRERQEKELLIQNLSNKMSQTEGMVSLVDINPINSSAYEEGRTTVVGCENDASIQKSNGLATLEKKMETRISIVYKTDGKQMLHNKELPKDCYKVSIDTSLVDAACIPDVGNNGFKTVKDAVVLYVVKMKQGYLSSEWRCVKQKKGTNTMGTGMNTDNNDDFVTDATSNEAGSPHVNFCSLETSKLTNDKAEVQIPFSLILEVHLRFGFNLCGYFVGKRVTFTVIENYVRNVWKKYGIHYVFTIMRSYDWELKKEMIIAIPNVEENEELDDPVNADSEMDEVYDETANFMAQTGSKTNNVANNSSGVGNKS